MKRTILIFTALIAALLILFQLSKYSIIRGDLKTEFAIAGFAVIFFTIGIVINRQYRKTPETSEESTLDLHQLEKLEISKREYEVLQLIAEGLSNKEIADRIFVAESTVKSHISSLFSKLDAKRRTQAIQRAKDLKIL